MRSKVRFYWPLAWRLLGLFLIGAGIAYAAVSPIHDHDTKILAGMAFGALFGWPLGMWAAEYEHKLKRGGR